MKQVRIYTDGACSGNPGPGGFGAVLLYGDREKEISGGEKHTTNQRMELLAAISALEQLSEPCAVKLHSDSAYMINAFQQRWFDKWLKNGWQNSKKEPVVNRDLWERLLAMSEKHVIEWVKVKGHTDDVLNNRCDQLAREAVPKV